MSSLLGKDFLDAQNPKSNKSIPNLSPGHPAQPAGHAANPALANSTHPNHPTGADSAASSVAKPAHETPIQFKTENINNWRSRQANYFDDQNQKIAAKKQKRSHFLKKFIPIASAVFLAVLGLSIWGIISLINSSKKPEPEPVKPPEISGGTADDIFDYRDKLTQIIQESGNIGSVNEAVDSTLNTDQGKEYSNEVKLAQMNVYMDVSRYEDVLALGRTLNVDEMDNSQKQLYYTMMSYSSGIVDPESEETSKYQFELIKLNTELSEGKNE